MFSQGFCGICKHQVSPAVRLKPRASFKFSKSSREVFYVTEQTRCLHACMSQLASSVSELLWGHLHLKIFKGKCVCIKFIFKLTYRKQNHKACLSIEECSNLITFAWIWNPNVYAFVFSCREHWSQWRCKHKLNIFIGMSWKTIVKDNIFVLGLVVAIEEV